MSAQYCFTPSTPYITGIGVRVTVYGFTWLNVIHAIICRVKNGHASEYLQYNLTAQAAIHLASILYIICNTASLSTFDELVFLNVVESSYLGALGALAISHKKPHPSRQKIRKIASWTYKLTLLALLLVVVKSTLSKRCIDHPSISHEDPPIEFIAGLFSMALNKPSERSYLGIGMFGSTLDPLVFALGWYLFMWLRTMSFNFRSDEEDREKEATENNPSASRGLRLLYVAIIVESITIPLLVQGLTEFSIHHAPARNESGCQWNWVQVIPLTLLYIPVFFCAREFYVSSTAYAAEEKEG